MRSTLFQTRKDKLLLLLPSAPSIRLLELMRIYDLKIERVSSRWFETSTNAYMLMLGLVTLTKFGSRANKITLLMASLALAFRQYEHRANKVSLIQERELIRDELEARQLTREIQNSFAAAALQEQTRPGI
jgi:hypothetical protein